MMKLGVLFTMLPHLSPLVLPLTGGELRGNHLLGLVLGNSMERHNT